MEPLKAEEQLVEELSVLIERVRIQTYKHAISSVNLLFWQLGKRINEYILQYARAEYGKQIVVTLSRQLVSKYGRNFDEKNLWRMLQFADQFKDHYLLDFLGLNDDFLEKDLEDAILNELEKFILELGKGFAFVERQKRMIIDGDDYNLDLLFYHRKLKRLVAIELKIGKFKAKYKSQMELYLKWLDRYEKQDDELPPIGLILCTETSKEQIELLEMHKDGIMVAEYWTELPPRKELEKRVQLALTEAKERLEKRQLMI